MHTQFWTSSLEGWATYIYVRIYNFMNMTRIHLCIYEMSTFYGTEMLRYRIFDEKYINYEEGGYSQEHPQQNYTLASKNH